MTPLYKKKIITIVGIAALLTASIGFTTACSSDAVGEKEREALHDTVVALRDKGKDMRNQSRFNEALRLHTDGLNLAKAIGDTSEWIQALNNIGTDYRRMGVYDIAQEYHYSAYTLCQESTDTSYAMRKNRVISLNGLGNIYLSIRSYESADSVFRMALEGERQLGSKTGQAINYANLGAIYNAKGDDNKALEYYLKSMELNTADNNTLGISLCHTYLGNIYEKHHQYDNALKEYTEAYRLMVASEDKWHALEPQLALVSIYIDRNDDATAARLLANADSTAESIHSIEHKAQIHNLYYKMYSKEGRYHEALNHHVRSTELQDSILNMEKNNRIHNIGITIERGRQQQRVNLAQQQLRDERTSKYVGYAILAFIVLLLLAIIGIMFYAARVRAHSSRILREAGRIRERFFTNITHEFRTPLTVILGLSKDIHDNADADEDIRRKADTIERNGNRLLTLISQILDISRIKSEIGAPDWQYGNIVAQVDMIVECNFDYAATRDIAIKMQAPQAGIYMDFVPDYVNKVMTNLLSNALKYTPDGGNVDITMSDNAGTLTIVIADTGRGIDADKLPHIFKPFYRAAGEDDDTAGSGIGLALVQQIMDAIGGTIDVASKPGKGTTFTLNIPIHENAKAQSANAHNTAPVGENDTTPHDNNGEASERKYILVIEDNKDVSDYICSLLTPQYYVKCAANGRQGLAMAQDIIPDIIITDVMMPEIDGLELCRQIRKDRLINHIPIIMVTARITEEERIRGIEAGADAYLAKPFNANELRTRIQKLLEQRRLLRDKFAKAIFNAPAADTTAPTETPTMTDPFLDKTNATIREMLISGDEVTVTTLADKMGINTRQLHRKITTTLGQTPVTYIRFAKVQYGCELLRRDPEMALKSVAIDCGFNDYSHFARSFKEVLGKTAGDFIKDLPRK